MSGDEVLHEAYMVAAARCAREAALADALASVLRRCAVPKSEHDLFEDVQRVLAEYKESRDG